MMKAAIISNPESLIVKDVEIPKPAPDEVLIQVKASGICGTDLHIFHGDYVGTYPVIPGHEFSGIIVEAGEKISRFKIGDSVAVEPNISCDNCPSCLENRQNFCENWQALGVLKSGAMAEYVLAPEKAVFPIGSLSFQEGAFVEPLSCVLHGVERCGITMADRVLVIGAGPIGNLLIQSIRMRGASEIVAVDLNTPRLELAATCGAKQIYNTLNDLDPDSFDVVVDATGVPALMAKTLNYVRYGGKILLFGVPPQNGRLDVPAFDIFRKGLSIFSSFTSVRNSLQSIKMLQSGSINVSKLVSHTLPLEELGKGIKILEKGTDAVLKVHIDPAILGWKNP